MNPALTILIVDDGESNRFILREQLEQLGYATCEAADGVEAIAVLERRPVDLVVSDILMPRMDGYRLCQEIRQRADLRRLPIIVYTGTYLSGEDRKLALRSGADRYLMKPATLADLRRVIHEIVGQPGEAAVRPAPPPDDPAVMREYNSVLIHKLEEKTRELEARNAELGRVNLELERDVTARRQAEDELREVSARMRALALRLQNIREEERTRIAREIHDVLAQELTRLKIDLVWLARRTAKAVDASVLEAMRGRVGDALGQADVAIATVQRIATELRPVILDSLGLAAAVEWQTEDFARRTGLECEAYTPGGEMTIDRDRATALFRILQESLTNVARHAQARRVEVRLVETGEVVTLTIRDDGRGISAAELTAPQSIGLAGMRERAQAFGGAVEIAPGEPAGTVVSVRLPLETENAPVTSTP